MARKSRKVKSKPKQTKFFVAMEGSVTERKYFDAFVKTYNLRNVRLLKKPKTRSSPIDVVKRLEKEMTQDKRDHYVAIEEKYWAVFDTDNRPIETLKDVAVRAARKNICLAPSNPCFEIWLTFHFGSLNECKGLEGSSSTGGCESAEKYLKKNFDPNYDKRFYDQNKYIEFIEAAIKNAKVSDSEDTDAWMKSVGTRVYKLIESIRRSST